MRRYSVCIIASALITPTIAFSLSVDPDPQSLGEVEAWLTVIDDDLTKAQCGGWNFSAMLDQVSPVVTGVPGHRGIPLGHLRSGMAWRIEEGGVDGRGFEYPATAQGRASACTPAGAGMPTDDRTPPFYQYLPCERPGPSVTGEGVKVFANGIHQNTDPLGQGVRWTCDALCEDLNRRWIFDRFESVCCEEDESESSERQSSDATSPPPKPAKCWVHQYEPSACYDTDIDPQPPLPEPPEGCDEPRRIPHQCCTGHRVDMGLFPNCVPCLGDDCRKEVPVPTAFPGDIEPTGPYRSFYRRYEPLCQYPSSDGNGVALSFPISCYGWLATDDPKEHPITPDDLRCTFGVNREVLTLRNAAMWAHGVEPEYGQESTDRGQPDPAWPDPADPLLDPAFDPDRDLWVRIDGTSLINPSVLRSRYGGDLALAALQPDRAEYRAGDDVLFRRIRARRIADHTVVNERRGRQTIVEWWQELLTEFNKLTSVPKLKVLLPPSYIPGFETIEQSGAGQPREIIGEDGRTWVEFVLGISGRDTLEEALRLLEDLLFLRFQEEQIPILVPLADSAKLIAASQVQCARFIARARSMVGDAEIADQIVDCEVLPSGMPGEVSALHAKVTAVREQLELYVQRVRDVHRLRADLPQIVAAILEKQRSERQAVHEWLAESLALFEVYLDSVEEVRGIEQRLQEIQERYRMMHNREGLCRNDRFIVSVYSLLYPWLPGAPPFDGGLDALPTFDDPTVLPRFRAPENHDVILDVSGFFFDPRIAGLRRGNIVAVPVPKPVPVEINIDPLFVLDEPVALPPLPPLPSIAQEAIAALELPENPPGGGPNDVPPAIDALFPLEIPLPPPQLLERVEGIIEGMEGTLGAFWESVNPRAEVRPGTEEDCIESGRDRCVHLEFDLAERTRYGMCVRAPFDVAEDTLALGPIYNPAVHGFHNCPRSAGVCDPLNPQAEYVYRRWHLDDGGTAGASGPDDDPFPELRRLMFLQTVLEADTSGLRIPDRERLLPSFENPGASVDLLPSPPP